jgi:hypothetical protein
MHASNYSADGPWIFDLENALVGSMDDIATRKQNSKQGSKFCMR